MASIQRRGKYWRVQVRRKGHPDQTRSFDTKSQAEIWACDIESAMERGVSLDRREAERNTLFELMERYVAEVTPERRGAGPETARLKALPSATAPRQGQGGCPLWLAHCGYRDEPLAQASSGTVNKALNRR